MKSGYQLLVVWLFPLAVSFTMSMGATIFHEEPLFVTPYIQRGDVMEGQKAAKNPNYFGDKESYSGYFTVNKSTNTNLFFWYFKSETAPEGAPMILWLQGGPGASSLAGAFLENGPYKFLINSKLEERKHYWSQRFHLLYIDNPVGTGFSFTGTGSYAVDEDEIGMTLYNALSQFFQLFPEVKSNRFYLAGESYAGKYIPALAFYIHQNNQNTANYINLCGIALGNAIIDPVSQLDNGDLYYQLGIFNDANLREYKTVVQAAVDYIKSQSWMDATSMYFRLMDITNDASRLETLFNLVKDKNDLHLSELEAYLNTLGAKRALHVARMPFCVRSSAAYNRLMADRTKSVKPWFREILENYDVLVYNGQLDLNKPYSGMVHFMNQLEWSGSSAYQMAPRHVWKVNGNTAGYIKVLWHKTRRNKPVKFMEVLVRNAGHLVPHDQPLWAMNMMMNFTGV